MKKRQYYNFEDYIDRYTFKDMNNHIKEINKEIEESNEMIKTIREQNPYLFNFVKQI